MSERFAARGVAGSPSPVTLSKTSGMIHTQRMPDGQICEMLVCGNACSECFSGPNLYRILQKGFEYECRVMQQLADGVAAEPLSIHTSSGVLEPLEGFIEELGKHLPWKENKDELDWCVSLQIEGTSAVFAAIDMILQVSALEDGCTSYENYDRIQVAVGRTSYHGPGSTSFGSRSPMWHKHNQVLYPVPTAGSEYDERELIEEFKSFLDNHAHEVGCMLIEPQWGSSQAAFPWPEHLLKEYVKLARERNIKIICDEIMCGLGRHGKGTMFASVDLDPDAITFGKAIATGIFPMSGVILKRGRDTLQANGRSVIQSHTYSGSSTRALMAGREVLMEVARHLPSITHLGNELGISMKIIQEQSQGLFVCHGQGLMWGGLITHGGRCSDDSFRRNVFDVFKKNCRSVCVLPYFVPAGGFMITPVLDVDEDTIREIGERLKRAVLLTLDEIDWKRPATSST